MCQWANSEVVPLPDHIDPNKEVRSVSLDRCIADIIKKLWEANIQTLGCCCGHEKVIASIVIPTDASAVDISRAATILSLDHRRWEILQWKLTAVARA